MTHEEITQSRRDQNPTPEAVFAMHHWGNVYAMSRLGAMGFYEDYLSDRDRRFCEDAVKRIAAAMKAHGYKL